MKSKLPFILAAVLSATALLSAIAGEAAPVADGQWVGTWVSAQQLVEPQNLPPQPGLAGHTLRQVIRPSIGGEVIRVTFSNAYGESPLGIAAANVARSTGGSAIDPAGVAALTFGGEHAVTIQPGTSVISDPVQCKVQALENLAVSTVISSMPVNVTGHPGSRTTSFIQPGDAATAAELPEAKRVDHWYLLAAVDVQAGKSAGAVVVIGDSITDGRGSTTNQNNRWPDNLARQLRANPRTRDVSVLNQGIGGNRVLRNGLGPSALERFDRDVLVPPGVRWLVIFEGINDLGTAKGARTKGQPATTARDIILGLEQMIVRAQTHGLRVYGATLMPFQGFASYYDDQGEADRQEINRWIRTSGRFDAVIDFDAIARDRQNPLQLSAAVDGGDHLHPSVDGHKMMGEAIDLALFEDAATR